MDPADMEDVEEVEEEETGEDENSKGQSLFKDAPLLTGPSENGFNT